MKRCLVAVRSLLTLPALLLGLSLVGCGEPTIEGEEPETTVESLSLFGTTENGVCWRQTYTRGVGTIPYSCDEGERSGLLCYPACDPGFTGLGPVCWENCPEGYSDDGLFCRKNATIIWADNSACPWYDVCGLTFARNCSTCPEGYKNDGCTCRIDAHIFIKSAYGRGVGWPTNCAEGNEYDAGLCYAPCTTGYAGVGPVCWAECSAITPVACGAGCADTALSCASALKDQILSPISTVVSGITGDYVDLAVNAVETFNAYNLPLCAAPSAN
jgi:hypothetical protein